MKRILGIIITYIFFFLSCIPGKGGRMLVVVNNLYLFFIIAVVIIGSLLVCKVIIPFYRNL